MVPLIKNNYNKYKLCDLKYQILAKEHSFFLSRKETEK